MTRVIVAGSRSIAHRGLVKETIRESPYNPFHGTLICGGASDGVDPIAKEFAQTFTHIEYVEVPAEWDKYGKAAGPKRNRRMAREFDADALIAIWDGESSGTRSMIEEALDAGLSVHVRTVSEDTSLEYYGDKAETDDPLEGRWAPL